MRRPTVLGTGALALVTGAGSGIGRSTALALAERGARVVAADINGDTAARTATDCGGRWQMLDVGDRDQIASLAEKMTSVGDVPDILVNNAGVGLTGRLLDMSPEDWEWIVRINFLGAVNMCLAFGEAMTNRGSGHVVNVSSGLAYAPRSTEPGYVSTKAALLAFSQCLRADWRAHDVGVSAVCPGVIATNIVKSNTRYRGSGAGEASRTRIVKVFEHGHRPGLVAKAVIGAIDKDKVMVTAGAEAGGGWVLHRLLPLALVDRLAGLGAGGL